MANAWNRSRSVCWVWERGRRRHGERAVAQRGRSPAARVAASRSPMPRRARIDPESASGARQDRRIGDDAFAVVEDPEVEIVVELIGGYSPGARAGAQGHRQRQARGHRQQGPDRPARQRDLRRRARSAASWSPSRPRSRAASRSSRRCARAWRPITSSGSPASSTARATSSSPKCATRAATSPMCSPRPRRWATPRPIRPSTSRGSTPPTSSPSSAPSPSASRSSSIGASPRASRRSPALDVAYAAELGYRIKHLGHRPPHRRWIELRVHPTLIPARRLIANVDGVMNAVLVKGDAVGPTLYYGAGAGAEPTASAVVADLVDVVRALTTDPNNRVPHLAFQPDELADTAGAADGRGGDRLLPAALRLDRPGVMAASRASWASRASASRRSSRRSPPEGETQVPLVMLTHQSHRGAHERGHRAHRGAGLGTAAR
jgi:homoserine dehydrogenase